MVAPSAAVSLCGRHLEATARSVRRELTVDRISIALVDVCVQTFRIIAWDGKGLLAAGTELPLETSTQVAAAARGERYAASDFRSAPGWDRASDRLMLAVGFVSGCSVPLRHPSGAVCGVASISATQVVEYDSRCAALDRAAPILAALLWPEDAPPPPHLTRPRTRAPAAAGERPTLQADCERALDLRTHGERLCPRHVPQAVRELPSRGSLRSAPAGPPLAPKPRALFAAMTWSRLRTRYSEICCPGQYRCDGLK